jgi:hypothetical protein
MVSNNYQDSKTWLNILFQISVALYVMQLKGLYLKDMTLADNVYIKELKTFDNTNGFWKYIIDDVTYYIPNIGYLVIIDSNFKDIIASSTMISKNREYKVSANNLFNEKYNPQDLKNKICANFKNLMSPNSFTREHTINNVYKPPQSIISFMTALVSDTSMDIGEIIFNNFKCFMNNRIGTYLNENEVKDIRSVPPTQIDRGEMIIYNDTSDKMDYKWGMFGKMLNNGNTEIYIKQKPEDEDIIMMPIRIENISKYNPSKQVEQTYKANENKFTDDQLKEIYIINNRV